MDTSFRRYEIFLPRGFDIEQSVLDELLGEMLQELEQQVGVIADEARIVRGFWHHQGQSCRRERGHICLTIEVAETPEIQHFFRGFKERLKARFRQPDIRMAAYAIEVI